jgi:hypothetical protein
MPTIAAHAQASVRSLRHLSATRLRANSGRARLPALRRGSRRNSHPCSALGHASWDVDSARCEHHARRKPAGVTRPLLSQSSDSTSRLGRNAEGNDAQSRPGAGCKPARRHRTRSASESALAKASLDERDSLVCNRFGDVRQVSVTPLDTPGRDHLSGEGTRRNYPAAFGSAASSAGLSETPAWAKVAMPGCGR